MPVRTVAWHEALFLSLITQGLTVTFVPIKLHAHISLITKLAMSSFMLQQRFKVYAFCISAWVSLFISLYHSLETFGHSNKVYLLFLSSFVHVETHTCCDDHFI